MHTDGKEKLEKNEWTIQRKWQQWANKKQEKTNKNTT